MEVKLVLISIVTAIVSLTGCYERNNQPNTKVSNITNESSHKVYVASTSNQSVEGDAAMLTGRLNVRNNCLFINDYLIIVQGKDIHWEQNPFNLYSGEAKFNLNDYVSAGGSAVDAESLKEIEEKNLVEVIPQECQTAKGWVLINISK